MTSRSMKFDPEAWLRDDIEAEWAVVREQMQRAAPQGAPARETKRGIPASEQTGIDAIINAGLVSSERLPMLDVVFDRLVRLMTASLRSLTSDNIEISVEAVGSVRFGRFLNDMPLPSLIGVARAQEWDNFALLVVRPELAFTIVDVLLSQQQLFQAQRNFSESRHNFLVNTLRLKQGAGTVSISDIQAVNALLLTDAEAALADSAGDDE